MHSLVLGAGYAGVTAALRLARDTGGGGERALAGTRLTLVNARDHFVERIRLQQGATARPMRFRAPG